MAHWANHYCPGAKPPLTNEDEVINHCDDKKNTKRVGGTKENVCQPTYYSLTTTRVYCRALKVMPKKANIFIWLLKHIVMELTSLLPCHWTQLKKE